ncbi:bifunctional lysylphosphatidylglycerol flippase/synthetase MprF [Capillimicrobium parvum]|uniref:Phosphatidylglycerol lysyltransferase C-terminal domain-containing protein n=1 Tax=Capillimicrobium parvum TaxID=2884022 RepID=A0A9E6XXX7_9ACTN|nr:phosphatidylglycerol lysyltransferase domain-containing protein [Capillimicrobium parvum]UGS36128.1 hypothetical protein DSM104329_02528 [Capillimicrobium parvum]
MRPVTPSTVRRPRRVVPAAAAGLVALAAALLAGNALVPSAPWRPLSLVSVSGGSPMAFGHVLALALGGGLVLPACGLWRGQRRAAVTAALGLSLWAGVALTRHGVEVRPLAVAFDALVVAAPVAAAALLRPAPAADGHLPAEHERATALVAAHSRDSLDPFILREDKSLHFAAGGVLGYRTLRATAIVGGDPVAPDDRAPAVLADFEARAARRGWDVVVTGASARHLDAYRAAGWHALRIGDEAVVDPRAFSLAGRPIRKVRQSVMRIARLGWSVDVLDGEQLGDAMGEIAAIDRRWRTAQPRLYGFAMTLGHLEPDGVYVLARDERGRLGGFLRFSRYLDGLSLDVMRREADTPNGLNEAMVVAALEYARAGGLAEVSLNFAGFAHVMAAAGPLSPPYRLVRWVLRRAHGRFQLERLVRFNAKFFPQWRPRFLLYRHRGALPRLALRVLQAEAYVRAPRCRMLPNRWLAPRPGMTISAPAATSPVATSVPARPSCGSTWLATGSEIAAASDAAPTIASTIHASAAAVAADATADSPAIRRSARPAANPAGSQATSMRSSPWRSPPASCCNGSAPATRGPMPSTPAWNSRYNQPTPANTDAMTARMAAGQRAADSTRPR